MLLASLAVAVLFAPPGSEKPLYPSSVVGTDFDVITDDDPGVFAELIAKGKAKPEMPDKADESKELHQPAFMFEARYRDNARISIAVDAAFATEDAARTEAMRYAARMGKLPSALRQGLRRLVVHRGGADTTAFSDAGLIVVYSDNATKRIGTHDLEETLFHESVHAAWDAAHRNSGPWIAAQKKDGRFATDYARKNPGGEDLAESALFAFALIHRPDRIPKKDAENLRRAIPARIAFVETLVPSGKPLFFVTCRVDLTKVGTLSDVASNALTRGLDQDEAKVRAWLDGSEGKFEDAGAFLAATAQEFGVEEKALKEQVEVFRHCNCDHAEVGSPVEPTK